MNVTAWWRGRGQHRAADHIAVLAADRDRWQALAQQRQDALAHADELIAKVCQRDNRSATENSRLRDDLTALRVQHSNAQDDYDQLAARYRDLAAELADLKAARQPAPDPEATQPIPTAALRFAHYAPNTQPAAA